MPQKLPETEITRSTVVKIVIGKTVLRAGLHGIQKPKKIHMFSLSNQRMTLIMKGYFAD